MHDKDYKDKEKCDLHGKKVKNKGDTDLCTDCENWDKMVWGFIFKKEDKDDEGDKDSIVFGGSIVNRNKNNFVIFM